ncbi:MAG: hypothetical protein WKH64_18105 [Chloroflexia bacterium]
MVEPTAHDELLAALPDDEAEMKIPRAEGVSQQPHRAEPAPRRRFRADVYDLRHHVGIPA